MLSLKSRFRTTSYKLQKFSPSVDKCIEEKFNDPNVVLVLLLKIKLKAHYITIDVTLLFLPLFAKEMRAIFVPEIDFNLFFGSYRKFPSIVIYATNQ